MSKTLGILIVTERHGSHLEAIVRSARRKRVQLRVHISGPGVRLCLKQDFQKVLAQIDVTICHHCADRYGIGTQLEACCPEMLTSSVRPPNMVVQCSRSIVL
jgi:hypothetical protein